MAGETSNDELTEIKVEVAEVEPISGVPKRSTPVPADAEPISAVPKRSNPVPVDAERVYSYKECRRNHAASFGRYAFDGCCEFMGSNDDAFICAACGCHRSFHRKEQTSKRNNNNYNSAVVALPAPQQASSSKRPLAPMPLASHNGLTGETSLFPRVNRNIDAGSKKLKGAAVGEGKGKDKKKRATRTRLTPEQKTKMTKMAEKLGWRPQRHDDAEVKQFCEEVGITKRVFVVWLNNNRRRKDAAI